MIESKKYTESFFTKLESKSYSSAKEVLLVLHKFIQPKSVIDVGCGTGMWLKVWDEQFNLKDYLGIEGPYLKPDMVKIPLDKIIFKDLKTKIVTDRKYDLAMSLEVGEHLPDDNAEGFVEMLTTFSDVVLFSAAIPQQEGTYHINEQFPEYWARHFQKFNFIPVDCIRPEIWNNAKVEYWYQQNCLLFVNKNIINTYPVLHEISKFTKPDYLTRIHPYLYGLKVKYMNNTRSWFGYLNLKWYLFKTKYIKSNAE